jgi:hypothetical protein
LNQTDIILGFLIKNQKNKRKGREGRKKLIGAKKKIRSIVKDQNILYSRVENLGRKRVMLLSCITKFFRVR